MAIDFANTPIEKLEQRYSREPESSEWTLNASTFIQGALDAEDAGLKTRFSVRCGTTICRVVFDSHDPRTLMEVGNASRTAGMSARYQSASADGGLRYIAYFGRVPTATPSVIQ